MKQTSYELLALLDRNLREAVTLLKRIAASPGQRSDVLSPLSNEVQYVRAQVGFEVTTEASQFEQANQTHWSQIHNRYIRWLKDPDDVFLEAEERDMERKKLGLAPRIVVLPWDSEEEETFLSARRSKTRKGRKNESKSGPRKAPAQRATTP
jgi:hypothetical protein